MDQLNEEEKMSHAKGRTIPLSLGRRLTCDVMHFGQKVPQVAIERRMELGELVAARAKMVHRPTWFAIFIRAYGQVAMRWEALRRSYMPYPWPRLYEHGGNVACLAIERRIDDDDGLLTALFRDPEKHSVAEIDEMIRQAKTKPVEEITSFRRLLRIARLPRPLRRLAMWSALYLSGRWRARYAGTFAVTGVGTFGATSVHLISPLTTTLVCGAIQKDGSAIMRLSFDHRVLDGIAAAKALADLETTLHESVLPELLSASRAA